MRGLIVRSLTAFAVLSVCALTLLRGSDIVRYSLAEARKGETTAVRSWTEVSGLAFSARKSSLIGIVDWNDLSQTARRRDEEMEILAGKPLSSEYWLLLSDMQFITGEPLSKVISALQLSTITGANESQVMWQRGLFGLSKWEILPSELQKRISDDVVNGPLSENPLQDYKIAGLRGILSKKSEQIRRDVFTSFEAQRISAKASLAIGM